jgi:hypothetical protein
MAWTTPRTWVAGEVVTASQMNTHVRDNLADLDARVNITPQITQATETITANGSLVNASGVTVLLLDPTAARDIYGCAVPPRSPWVLYIVNITSNNATLKHESGSEATPAKRFFLVAAGDVVLSLGEGIALLYISVPAGARWVSVVGS